MNKVWLVGLLLLSGCSLWDTPKIENTALTCGGIAGITCPDGYVCYYPEQATYPDAAGQCIPKYVDRGSVGVGCPVTGPFEVGFDSSERECACPAGYTKNSDIIGYENCYDGAECPILEVECVKAADAPIEVGPSDDDLVNLVDQGQLYNADYDFIITVGVDHAANLTEVAIVPFEGVTATYIYCYDTTEADYASTNCPETAVEAFRINIYTTEQYQAIADAPGSGTMITAVVGYVYELNHPNGLLPADVPADDTFYDTIINSFHFAG
ncbi:MAG: hypothetical protein HYV33_03120 [Candidatus Kerfeldbacteria bacterium]|nr:hypothetical protein [Candidatus Kerfeldbacteria bacterium]